MTKTQCVLAAGLLACVPVLAQNVLGTTTEVNGLVTVSSGMNLATATQGMPVVDGARYVTSSGSFATLKLNNGCVLRMKPNQSITVDGQKTCEQLLALLETSRDSMVAMQAGTAGGFNPLVGMAVLGGAALVQSASSGSSNSGGSGGVIPEPPISRQ